MIQYKHLGQYIPHIMKYQIITQLPSDIHLKLVNLSIKSSEIRKAVLTILGSHAICHFKAATSQNFTLAPHTHTLSSIPIGCHGPKTKFSVCSLVLKFSDSLYIHCDYLLFHIFAFINLTCFLSIIITR